MIGEMGEIGDVGEMKNSSVNRQRQQRWWVSHSFNNFIGFFFFLSSFSLKSRERKENWSRVLILQCISPSSLTLNTCAYGLAADLPTDLADVSVNSD